MYEKLCNCGFAAVVALCGNLAGVDGGDAVVWKAGAPAPGIPHVIMGWIDV